MLEAGFQIIWLWHRRLVPGRQPECHRVLRLRHQFFDLRTLNQTTSAALRLIKLHVRTNGEFFADAVASLTRTPDKNGSYDLALLQLRACEGYVALHNIVHNIRYA